MTNIKSSFSRNISLPLSQDCVTSLSMPVSIVCCGDLPCKILYVHCVSVAPRSTSIFAFSGTSTRFSWRSSDCYQASHIVLCMLDVWTFLLHVITHFEYRLAVMGRYVYNHSASMLPGECDPFNHRCWVGKAVLSK